MEFDVCSLFADSHLLNGILFRVAGSASHCGIRRVARSNIGVIGVLQ
jgi:hypothetical protein